MPNRPLLMLVDGNALVHRAFHALPPLTVPKTGEMVNAVYGFALMLLKAMSELQPTYCGVAFDRGLSFRREVFEQYKAQRKKAPDELSSQFSVVRRLVQTFGIPVLDVEGFEADDVLGTLARQATEQGLDTVIVTGDADALQLVSAQVKVLVPGRTFKETLIYDVDKVIEKYGVAPAQMTDLKALMGDPSDNIPGVPGVGEKTAAKLVQQFSSIDGIVQHMEEVSPPRVQQALSENKEVMKHGKSLVTIKQDVPVALQLKPCGSDYDHDKLVELFRELGFVSLVARLPHIFAGAAPSNPVQAARGRRNTVRTLADLESLAAGLTGIRELAVDVVGSGTGAVSCTVVGIALSPKPEEAYYIPVGHSTLEEQLPLSQVIEKLRPAVEDERMVKVGHNIKLSSLMLSRHGLCLSNIGFDTMVAAHLVGEKSLSLKALAFSRLGLELTTVAELQGKGAKKVAPDKLPGDQVSDVSCAAVDAIMHLEGPLEADLKGENVLHLFRRVEMPLVPVLAHMETSGVALDTGLLHEMSQTMTADMRRIEQGVYADVGHEFNLNSPHQLSHVLFVELGLPRSRRTAGGYSTEAAVLEELRGVHPAIDGILEYRQVMKLKSTYLDALPELVNPQTGRLHTSFNQTGTVTGRLSSSEPNLQNIPARGELGKKIRQAFVAPEGCRFLAGDYSQIDLRVLAHLSQDPTLMGAFERGEDIHSATASVVSGVPISQVTPEMRRAAKTVNFGVVYGMSEYGLEQATGYTREQAARFIKAYFEKYPQVWLYLESTKKQVRDEGYVQTMLGRRRYVPEVRSPNRMVREAAERMAINMPVQGTSADIIKVAMVELYRRIVSRRLKSKMVLQVHDELIFEVPLDEIEEVRSMVLDVMPNAIKLSVPLKVDIKIGRNWGEME